MYKDGIIGFSFNGPRQKWSIALLVFGMLYCLASMFGVTEAICHTQGCQIYKGYSFLGMSLYFWGVIAFGVCLILFVYRKQLFRRYLRDFYIYALRLFLVCEVCLLIYQAIYLPCFSCLVVAFVWGAVFALALAWSDVFAWKRNVWQYGLLLVWLVLFCSVFVSGVKELIAPWPIYGKPDAPIKIFFSPTCPACKQAVREIVESGMVDEADLALFPVAKNDEDKERICLLACSLRGQETDLEQALNRCWQPECISVSVGLWDEIRLRINLFRNRIVLSRMGANRVPVVISRRPLIVEGRDVFGNVAGEEIQGCGLNGDTHCKEEQ